MSRIALAALLALVAGPLAGCHRPQADQPNLGADSDAQANTAAKTLADLQAADDAAQGAPPQIAPARAPHEEKANVDKPEPAQTNDSDEDIVETNAD